MEYRYEVKVNLPIDITLTERLYEFSLYERYEYPPIGATGTVTDNPHIIFKGNVYITQKDITAGYKEMYITDLVATRKWDGDYTALFVWSNAFPIPLYNEYYIVMKVNSISTVTSDTAEVYFHYRYPNGSTDMIPTCETHDSGLLGWNNLLLQGNKRSQDIIEHQTPLIPHIPYIENYGFVFPLVFNWSNPYEETQNLDAEGSLEYTSQYPYLITPKFPTYICNLNLGEFVQQTQIIPATRTEDITITPFNQGSWSYWDYDSSDSTFTLPDDFVTTNLFEITAYIGMSNMTDYNSIIYNGHVYEGMMGVTVFLPANICEQVKDDIANGLHVDYFTIQVRTNYQGQDAVFKVDLTPVSDDLMSNLNSWELYFNYLRHNLLQNKYHYEMAASVTITGEEKPAYISMQGQTVAIFDECPAKYYVLWQDRGGAFQCQPFIRTDTYSEGIKRNTWNMWDGTQRHASIDVQPKWKLNTGWIDEKLMPYYESLYVSNNIELWDTERQERISCVLKDSSFTEKTFKNQGRKLFNIEIELNQSKTQNIIY